MDYAKARKTIQRDITNRERRIASLVEYQELRQRLDRYPSLRSELSARADGTPYHDPILEAFDRGLRDMEKSAEELYRGLVDGKKVYTSRDRKRTRGATAPAKPKRLREPAKPKSTRKKGRRTSSATTAYPTDPTPEPVSDITSLSADAAFADLDNKPLVTKKASEPEPAPKEEATPDVGEIPGAVAYTDLEGRPKDSKPKKPAAALDAGSGFPEARGRTLSVDIRAYRRGFSISDIAEARGERNEDTQKRLVATGAKLRNGNGQKESQSRLKAELRTTLQREGGGVQGILALYDLDWEYEKIIMRYVK